MKKKKKNSIEFWDNIFLFEILYLAPLVSFANPGISCKDIGERVNHRLTDGRYWIEPIASKRFSVYCDMTTDESKWVYVEVKQTKNKMCYPERGCEPR